MIVIIEFMGALKKFPDKYAVDENGQLVLLKIYHKQTIKRRLKNYGKIYCFAN